nr:MAG TPA: hypothetical protein [Caudoviricetes sp.]
MRERGTADHKNIVGCTCTADYKVYSSLYGYGRP